MRRIEHPPVIVRTYCEKLRISQSQHLAYSLFLIIFCWLVVVINSFAISKSNADLKFQVALISQGLYLNENLQAVQFSRALAVYERGEHYLAQRILLPLASKKHTEAEFYMGMIYDMGLGVNKDSARAVSWYKKAAKKDYHHAQHNLAVAYANGEGVKPNMKKALHWWQLAARQGNTDSQYNLGIIYATGNAQVKKDLLEAEKWWRKAAINGDAMAQYNLGALYANGEKKVTSYCEAIRWWKESARAGMGRALVAIELLKTRDDYHPC